MTNSRNALVLLAFVVLLPSMASALAFDISQFNGDMQLQLEKTSYDAGETLNAKITLLSMVPVPIAEASVTVELVKGESHYYPSTLSDNDNIFFEQRFDSINLRAGESKKLDFSFKLPEGISAGTYRIDAYFRTERSPIIGLTHIFLGPKSANFTVKNDSSENSFPELKILRTKTFFHDAVDIQTTTGLEPEGIGPIGPPTRPGAPIVGKVFVENTSKTTLKNIEVFAGLCVWDDSLCNSFLSQSTATIESIAPGEVKEASIQLTAPSKPDAYAIRLEARMGKKLVSLYRNRAVVVGEGSRIRMLYSANVELFGGKQAEFYSVISPSADHWLMPELKDFDLKFSLQDLKSGKTLFEKTERIAAINYSINFVQSKFDFVPQTGLDNYRICETIQKAGTTFDNYCVAYDSSKFSKILNYALETSFERKNSNALLELKFCPVPSTDKVNANFQLFGENTQDFIAAQDISSKKGCVSRQLSVDSSRKLVLAVTDYISRTQKIIPIGLAPEAGLSGGSSGNASVEEGMFGGSILILIIEALILVLAVFAAIIVFVKLTKKKKGKKK